MQWFFPVTPFVKIEKLESQQYIEKLIYTRQRAILMEVKLDNVRLIDEMWGDLYLSKDKCYNIINGRFYNGRILSADSLICCITEIDYMIIKETYSFNFTLLQWYKATKGKLPQCIIDFIIEQYRLKTELKGLTGDLNETLYMKSKNRLNGIYGLFATAPIREEIVYNKEDRDFHFKETEDIEELFETAKRSYWLPYQFGIYTCALARLELFKGIKNVSQKHKDEFTDFVYCDTDSVKYIGSVDWTDYNAEKIRLSKDSGAYATDAKGKTHYMGVFESDGTYERFKSCGAKKYAYEDNSGLHITVSGVNSKTGAKGLQRLENFQKGFLFDYDAAGKKLITYNDTQIPVEIVDSFGNKETRTEL